MIGKCQTEKCKTYNENNPKDKNYVPLIKDKDIFICIHCAKNKIELLKSLNFKAADKIEKQEKLINKLKEIISNQKEQNNLLVQYNCILENKVELSGE
jgi:hypothetical protein